MNFFIVRQFLFCWRANIYWNAYNNIGGTQVHKDEERKFYEACALFIFQCKSDYFGTQDGLSESS
jgi:hypothetical protein